MPRDLVLGNGSLLVTFDAAYTLRDVYYPHVGKENHTIGHPCRAGIWVDGRFSWLSDEGWSRQVRYRVDTLISDVVLEQADLGLRIHVTDAVHPTQAVLLRAFAVTNLADHLREVRLFFHHDFHILESAIGDTAYFEPVNRFVIHHKGSRYFLANGRAGAGGGIFQFATGAAETDGAQGTWRDAEDGWLEGNPIAQGSVDSTISFRQNVAGGDTAHFYYWLAVERDYWEVKALNHRIIGKPPAEPGAPDHGHERLAVPQMLEETDRHWREWIGRARGELADLPESIRDLYRRSLLVIRTQIDNGGAIIAANDGDSMMFNRDTYSYMWPRDGALVAHTLDVAGYGELTEQFLRFCTGLMPRQGYYPAGYLMHKFNADGSPGSSWHPWVRDGHPSLPIQEDETALVLWTFWRHVERMRRAGEPADDLLRELAPRLVLPAARFMLMYRDEPEGRMQFHVRYPHEPTGLPLPSYDLWEERYGIHTFTVAATCAGLDACRNLVSLIIERGWAADREWSRAAGLGSSAGHDPAHTQSELADLAERCGAACERMKSAMQAHLWSEERRSYARMLGIDAGGQLVMDRTLDAATMYALIAFEVFPASDPKVQETVGAIAQRLWCKTAVGGIARYENDYYYRKSDDIENVPGNPWFICTLWGALAGIALAERREDLARPRELLEWVCRHAQPSGILAEQVHPYTGAPLSVSPLTWSHAAFAETVHAYCARHAALG